MHFAARRALPAAVFAAYAALAAAWTWPIAAHPAQLALVNEDVLGNSWAMAWVVRQAVRDPLHLYDANLYYPYEHSLAFTESLLPEALQAAPVLLAGGGPLLAHNVVALLTFSLCGLGAYLLARDLYGAGWGGFLAGLTYAGCAYRFAHLVHVQSLSMQWFPFAFLFLHRAAVDGRKRDLAGLAIFSTLQALSSGYYALALAAGMAAALAAEWPVLRRQRTAGRVAMALVVAAGLTVLALVPYAAARSESGFTRSRQEMVHWSARWSSFLDPGEYAWLPHVRWLHERFASSPLYPGTAALALAVAGLTRRPRDPGRRLPLLLIAFGVALSLGPDVHLGPWRLPGPYELLRGLPLVDRLRTPVRLGVLAMLGISLLAAAGWQRLMSGRRGEAILAAAVATLMALEVHPLGLADQVRAAPAIPASARWLATAPRGPVLELPWDHQTEGRGALYLYWSTVHWQQLVNGWGAYSPPGPFGLGVIGHRWPSAYTARVFREAGIRYVVVHVDAITDGQRRRLMQEAPPEGTRLVFDSGWERIYELR
jgi:hypothetical protein